MPIYEPFALIALGVITGTYGVIIGAGGGFILGPMLILVWGLSPAAAVGTSTASVLITALSGAQGYTRARVIDYRSGILFGIAGIPGAALGAFAVAKAPGGAVQVSMGAMLLATALYMAARPVQKPSASKVAAGVRTARKASRTIVTAGGQRHAYSFSEPRAIAVNAVLGVVSTFFGIGGGLMRVPVLTHAFGFPVRVAVATSVLAMIPVAAVGTATHATFGNIRWPLLLFAGIGVVVGGQLGASIAPKLRQAAIIRMLAGGMGITGIWLIVKGAGWV
ncbi:MAG: sulfite exporter TauE/SafE family protein [Dehalococcoidia bacterium]|nr:sulfite exporter TauE/SafE family protein [Dehalococcoidia bacterium]